MVRVLLVCTGNICRSPMAEGFLADRSQRLLDGEVRVGSAGTWARRGRPPMPEAVQAAEERGVSIEDLRSTPMAPDLVAAADLVITMTAEQRSEVLKAAPEAAEKVFTLKELAVLTRALPPPGAPSRDGARARIADAHVLRSGQDAPKQWDEDVSDPIGLGLGTYRAVAWEIESLVDELVAGLFGAAEPAPRAGAEG